MTKAVTLCTTTAAMQERPASRQRPLLDAAARLVSAYAETDTVPDAREVELIRLCGRATELHRRFKALHAEIVDDAARAAPEASLMARWKKIERRIYELNVTPRTPAGIAAVSAAALAHARRDRGGRVEEFAGLDDYLAWTVVEAVDPAAAAEETKRELAQDAAYRRAHGRAAA